MSFIKVRRFVFCCLLLTGASALGLNNQLEGHPSPYLALHGSDPVAWQDWAPAAVELAREQGKLLYISVGYFSCHWCHVMQKESYKDAAIAKILNDNFIPVKVDRELEPALDARLIEFAQATQGRAGWPLNVFLTPEGYPLYAVLYLPSQDFELVLTRLQQQWLDDKENLSRLAAREAARGQGPGKPALDKDQVHSLAKAAVLEAMNLADTMQGGFGLQNKFPMAPQLEFLLERYEQTKNPELMTFLTLTLDNMAKNGMYDHVGDGFFRYSTGPAWETPHFEKMLYDNAQLAALYLRASSLFDDPEYGLIAKRTLDFMLRDMAEENGAMVASFSAVDDHDVEGGFYLWHKSELAELLTQQEKDVVQLAWNMEGPLVFEAGYLPKGGLDIEAISAKLQSTETEVEALLQSARSKLFAARATRVLPTDTKLLAGWNGLALAAFAEAARETGSEIYLEGARNIREYLVTTLWDGSSLRRAVDGMRKLGRASLEDYAYVARGLWSWAELAQKPEDYSFAASVIEQAWDRFYENGWRMAESSLMAAEPARDLISDGPMPSPSAVVAHLSLKIAAINNDEELRLRALAALNSGGQQLERTGFWNASHVRAMLEAVGE